MTVDYSEVKEEARVRDLQPEHKPELQYSDLPPVIDQILDAIGVEHDRKSIMREDSYLSIWYTNDYSEVWVSHYAVPNLGRRVYRLR